MYLKKDYGIWNIDNNESNYLDISELSIFSCCEQGKYIKERLWYLGSSFSSFLIKKCQVISFKDVI